MNYLIILLLIEFINVNFLKNAVIFLLKNDISLGSTLYK